MKSLLMNFVTTIKNTAGIHINKIKSPNKIAWPC